MAAFITISFPEIFAPLPILTTSLATEPPADNAALPTIDVAAEAVPPVSAPEAAPSAVDIITFFILVTLPSDVI